MDSFHPQPHPTIPHPYPTTQASDAQRALTNTLPSLPPLPLAHPHPVFFPFSPSSEHVNSYRRKLALKIQAFVI
jgi:hypothetical protein